MVSLSRRRNLGSSLATVLLLFTVLMAACSQPSPSVSPAGTSSPPAQAAKPATQPTAVPAAAQPAAPPPAYKVGLLGPITGAYATYMVDSVHGVEFAVEEINNSGGIKGLGGAKIELVKADSALDVKTSLSLYEQLVAKDKVDFVIGPSYNGQEIRQVAPLADKYEMPSMSIGGPGDDLAPLDLKWVVHLGPMNYALGTAETQYAIDLAEELNMPRNSIVYGAADLQTYRLIGQAVKDVAAKRGYGDKVKELYFPDSSPDLNSVALNLKSMKPDIFIGNSAGAISTKMIQAMNAVEFYPPIWADTTAVFDPKTREGVGVPMWNKVVGRPGNIGYAYANSDYSMKSVVDFEQRVAPFLKARNAPYTTRVAYAQAVYALVKVLNDVKTRDKAAVNKAMHAVSIPQTDPYFVSGQFAPAIEFLPNGTPKNIFLLGVQQQMVGSEVKEKLVYPKNLRAPGVTLWAK